jgi:caspase domain-containing protein
MISRIIICFVSLLSLFLSPSYSQTLHVISVANTNDPRLGAGFSANAKSIRDYAALVSSVSGLALDMKEIIGADYTCEGIKESVNFLSVQSADDVILFYHSGHGLSPAENQTSTSASKYPSFDCEKNGADEENIAQLPNLENISESLRSKGAGLTLVAADSCNVVLPRAAQFFAAKGFTPSRIKAMFRDFKGSILMSSSVRGQYSWYTSDGGLFTNRLIDILRAPDAQKPQDLWADTIKAIQADIYVNAGGVKTLQKPQVDAVLSYDK